MYRLRFDPNDETAADRYKRCFTAIVLTGKQVQVSEWDDLIALLKAFKSIGHDPEQMKNPDVPVVYVLNDSGGQLLLQRSEYNTLLDLIKQPIWRPAVLENVKATKTWLEGLVMEQATAAKPVEVESVQS